MIKEILVKTIQDVSHRSELFMLVTASDDSFPLAFSQSSPAFVEAKSENFKQFSTLRKIWRKNDQ